MLGRPASPFRSVVLLCALIALVLLGGAGWSLNAMLASKQRLTDASLELNLSQQRIEKIQRFQTSPKIASLDEETSVGMQERAEKARVAVGIPSEKLTKIDPQPAIQLQGVEYKQRSTEIALKGVSMQELVQFGEYLEDPTDGITVRGLVLKASNLTTKSDLERWDVTLTLTQLIFSPTS